MAQPEPEQRPLTDDELEEGRKRLKEFFEEVAEETGRPVKEFRPETD